MLKKILTAILAVALVVFSGSDAFAGKGYSSGGGRSYSSSSRSFSSPSRSFSSSSSKSFSSSSKSYSSGSKSYSSGSKGYSSGSKSSVTPSHTNSTHQSTGPPSKNYTSGNKGYTSSGSSYSRKPTGNFQSLAATEQRKAESRAAYQKATAPKESYTTPKGNTVTIKKDDARVISVRNMPEEKWVNRETRVQTFYHSYYYHVPPTVVHYNDPYSTFFWLWMLDRSLDDRAYWAYHHRYDMDEARYRDLLAKDRALEARIRQLEAEKKARDPNYVPPGMPDADLQYTDDFVNASINPEPKPYTGMTAGQFFHGLWVFIKWCFYIALIIAVIWFLVWLVFYKRW
jgi:hypothetical protein